MSTGKSLVQCSHCIYLYGVCWTVAIAQERGVYTNLWLMRRLFCYIVKKNRALTFNLIYGLITKYSFIPPQ